MKPSAPSTRRGRTAPEDGETGLPLSTQLRKVVVGGTPKKATLLLFSVAVLLTGGALAVRGQSVLDGFDPNANGPVQVVVVQPDGKILLGGNFTTILDVARNRLARLNPDGTLDAAFDPNASGIVYTIALQADGKILVGGAFNGANSMGGQTRNRIARLDPTTGAPDLSFDPNANNDVLSLVVQADGKILVGGSFSGPNSIGGQTRNRIARLNPDGTLDTAFDPNANHNVTTIALQADGKILACGFFSGVNSIGGQARNRIARLDPTTGQADSFDPNANGVVYTMALQADGKILAGGFFSGANSIGGQTRNCFARLDPATGLADSFDPNASAGIFAVAVQADGRILTSGAFSSIGGQTRNRIARLDPATGLADAFDPNADATASIYSIALQADGKILAGGAFTNFAPNGGAAVTRTNIARLETDGRLDRTLDSFINNPPAPIGYVAATAVQPDGKILLGGYFAPVFGTLGEKIARLNPDGTLDPAFNPNPNDNVLAIAVQADGKILVGGYFSGIGGQTRIRIARLDTNGVADPSFNPILGGVGNVSVSTIAIQADGKILAGGDFSGIIGGQMRNRIARLHPNGTLDTNFNPNANGYVSSIAVQADGKILVGGEFTSIGGQTRNHIARLDATTGLADSFNPNANTNVYAFAMQSDGKILVGGQFTSIGGSSRNCIARLDANTGTADLTFDPIANASVYSIALQADGKILVGGDFTDIGGATRNRIARLEATTGLADSFDPNAAPLVYAIALQADGKILLGGNFAFVGGQSRLYFARLKNDITTVRTLAVTRTAVTWIGGGSSPLLARATFESSTDSMNYTPLGNGSAAGTNWTLTGLNLPTGQNLYIRARGFYRGGVRNGSESITELVRNVFLTPLPLLNIQRSANTNVVLSWATNFTGFTLEGSTNLNTNVWSVVSPAPAVSGTNNVVTNATSDSTRFYRLRK